MFNTEFLAQITLLRKYLLGSVLSACLFTYAIYVLPSRIYPRRDGGGGEQVNQVSQDGDGNHVTKIKSKHRTFNSSWEDKRQWRKEQK